MKLSAKDKKLQAQWYKRLAKEGFEDIEQDEDNLKRWDSMYFISRHTNFKGRGAGGAKDAKFSAIQFESRQEYYQLAGAFLHEHEFETDKERLIWELHASGENLIDIYRTLKKMNKKVYLEGIDKTIKRLSEAMVKKCLSNP